MRGPLQGSDSRAELTVGMPVFNNASTIRRALESLLAQSFANLEIVVSDNSSRDGTADICDEYVRSDARVTLARQAVNLNYGNFRYVLSRARTPYFMFAAGDDYWHADYAARMVAALRSQPSAVCAVSQVAFVRNGEVIGLARGTKALTSDVTTNVRDFLASRDDNSRMYGVFRTDVARRAFPPGDFFASDWAFSAGTLLEGTHLEIPEVLCWRDYTPPQRYIEYVRRDAKGVAARVFPALPLTTDLLRRLKIPRRGGVGLELVRLNAAFHQTYMRRYHPRIARFTTPIVEAVLRRI